MDTQERYRSWTWNQQITVPALLFHFFSKQFKIMAGHQGWDNHPLRSEGGLTPNQLWVMGHMQNSSCNTEVNLQNLELFGTDWESLDCAHKEPFGVQVPQIESPLTPAEMETVKAVFKSLATSESYGSDIYVSMVQYIKSL